MKNHRKKKWKINRRFRRSAYETLSFLGFILLIILGAFPCIIILGIMILKQWLIKKLDRWVDKGKIKTEIIYLNQQEIDHWDKTMCEAAKNGIHINFRPEPIYGKRYKTHKGHKILTIRKSTRIIDYDMRYYK